MHDPLTSMAWRANAASAPKRVFRCCDCSTKREYGILEGTRKETTEFAIWLTNEGWRFYKEGCCRCAACAAMFEIEEGNNGHD